MWSLLFCSMYLYFFKKDQQNFVKGHISDSGTSPSSYPLGMQDRVKIYAAPFQYYSLTGYDITSKTGTKKQPSRLILSRPALGLIFPNAKWFIVSGHLGNSIL